MNRLNGELLLSPVSVSRFETGLTSVARNSRSSLLHPSRVFRKAEMERLQPVRRDATVADVAKRAGVSKAQAARALGNYGAVSDDVRERVLAAAQELDYRPNELARTMNTGKSHTLGVVVGDIENPHFGLLMRGISDTAKRAGFDVILVNTGEDVTIEQDAVQVLLDKRVDGLIVAPASSLETEHLRRVYESGRPLVLVDRQAQGVPAEVMAVDMTSVAFASTRHLLEQGHTRIAFVSTIDSGEPYRPGIRLHSSQIMERLTGMEQAFGQAGLSLPPDLVRLNAGNADSIRRITRDLLAGSNPATAIVASDGLIALSVVEEIQALDLDIPGEVSILMYDDFPWTRLTTPPLSVIAQPVYDIGAAAAKTVIARISGRVQVPATPAFEATLILRGSIGVPPSALPEAAAS